jgi:hypothetical protein
MAISKMSGKVFRRRFFGKFSGNPLEIFLEIIAFAKIPAKILCAKRK